MDRYPPRKLPMGPRTARARVPMIRKVSMGTNTRLTALGMNRLSSFSTWACTRTTRMMGMTVPE